MTGAAPEGAAASAARRVAIFGGSFNPPHLGHVLAAVTVRAVHAVDAVWVLPSFRHPWGKVLAPFATRLDLCHLAFAGLPGIQVRADEQANPGGTTWALIDVLESRHPGTRFALVGGTDIAAEIRSWFRGEDLARRVDLLVVPRRGFDDSHPAALPAISSSSLRERIAKGQPIDGLVPAAVARRIAELGLYRA